MRIRDVSLLINSVEYKCRARSLNLDPLDGVVLCTDDLDYELTAEIEVTYGASGTWNLLNALNGTLTTFVVKPNDAAVAAGNPSASFSGYMPAIPFVRASPGEVGTFELVVQSEGGVTTAVA